MDNTSSAVAMDTTPEASQDELSITIRSLSGTVLAELHPWSSGLEITIEHIKGTFEEQTGCPRALQKLIDSSCARVFDDWEVVQSHSQEILMVVDETPLSTWDISDNPRPADFESEGGIVRSPNLSSDYNNVITKEPIRKGAHYFEFVMHTIGDEQWCGIVADDQQMGPRTSGRGLKGWLYYCGRMNSHNSSSIVDGMGALHAEGKAVTKFRKLKPSGDIIGMLVDMDKGAVAFDLNGELQGACAIPTHKPLWCLTHMDTRRDHVELRKASLLDAPPANLEALSGALLEITQGQEMRGSHYSMFGGSLVQAQVDVSDDDDDTLFD